jgi:hypothetical protein
LPFIDER